MKINNSGYGKYISRSYEKSNITSRDISDKEQKSKNVLGDRLEISSSFRKINSYVDQIKNKDVDLEKVNYIKNAIAKGQYSVSSKELAGKIIDKIKEDL